MQASVIPSFFLCISRLELKGPPSSLISMRIPTLQSARGSAPTGVLAADGSTLPTMRARLSKSTDLITCASNPAAPALRDYTASVRREHSWEKSRMKSARKFSPMIRDSDKSRGRSASRCGSRRGLLPIASRVTALTNTPGDEGLQDQILMAAIYESAHRSAGAIANHHRARRISRARATDFQGSNSWPL